MDKKMEKIIASDLGMNIDEIRRLPWNRLEKKHYRIFEKAFKPKDMFIIGGNINLTLKREMGMLKIDLSEIGRKVSYKIKCLRKNRKNV